MSKTAVIAVILVLLVLAPLIFPVAFGRCLFFAAVGFRSIVLFCRLPIVVVSELVPFPSAS